MSKNKVYEEYEHIHEWFDAHRDKSLMEKEYLDLILANSPKQATVLDLGCGTGEPLAAFFIDQGYHVTGVDGSTKMIALCKARFPEQTWLCADMREIDLHQQFDVILAWHSFFHLPQSDQRKMFAKFAMHLKPGAVLAFTSGPAADEVWSDNGGQNLYHASLSIAEYQSLLKQNGLEVLLHKVEDPDCGEATTWVAQKQVVNHLRTGRCQCGAIQYKSQGEPIALYVCHCPECRKQSASAFGISLDVKKSQFQITHGQPHFWSRPTSKGDQMRCAFCPECGSRLWHESVPNVKDLLSIKGGSLDQSINLSNAIHVWTKYKLPGVVIPESAAQFPEED